VDYVDDLGVVDRAEVRGGHAEVGLPELALDDDQGHALTRHLNGMRVSQLVRREPAANSGFASGVAKLRSDPSGSARPTARRSSEHTEQRVYRKRGSEHEPRLELLPCPAVHPDLTPLTTLATADQHSAARGI
jgi:hypothetical protein